MRAAVEVQAVEPVAAGHDWSLWMRQIRAILRIEVKKNFWGRRALLIYLLAAVPVFLMFLLAVVHPHGGDDIRRDWTGAQTGFVVMYRVLILQTMVYFGCAWIFMNLFRGEVVDKSLHYYFLCALPQCLLMSSAACSLAKVSRSISRTGMAAKRYIKIARLPQKFFFTSIRRIARICRIHSDQSWPAATGLTA